MRPKTSVTPAPNWAPNDVAKLESAGKSGLGENAEITAAVIYNSTIRICRTCKRTWGSRLVSLAGCAGSVGICR
ncbi:MAG: hypothetical protein ACXV5D_06685 [Halobacteriota archaeon]